ncbi:hypothetical protein [Streptomyces sp. NRRL S-244]|uniref:hypothetical protein n=1 Tax=Streptomyces sp. NRRL S-244 TaxID=1463897 RepID=UPI0004C2672B|nr:hypothetical protein [Streptomyces sp. NRRL S-244]
MGHSPRACRTGRVATVVFAALLALSVGCSNIMELPYTPERMDPDPARTKTREVSGRLLEMAGITGKVTETGMSALVCDEYGDDLFALQHHWSVNGLTSDQVDTGVLNLRKALGENGWKIREGRPEISASNEKELFAVTVTADKTALGQEPMLNFSVSSPCYRAASHAAANKA